MYNMQEQNARRSRQLAVVLTIAVHLLAVASLYLQSASKSTTPTTSTIAAPSKPAPQAVHMP